MASLTLDVGVKSISDGSTQTQTFPLIRSGRLALREPQYKRGKLATLEQENNRLQLEVTKLRRERDRLQRLVYKNRMRRAKAKKKAELLAATAQSLRASYLDAPKPKPKKSTKPRMLRQVDDYKKLQRKHHRKPPRRRS